MDENLKVFAWNLFTDLRKELVSLQAIRSQVTGFKITFVSASIALIGANLDKVSPILFVVPGFAAIFFDLLTHSYSYSIKRTGFYCRTHLEPILSEGYAFPRTHPLWEEFMASPEAGKNVSFWGNLGLTLIAVVLAIAALLSPFTWNLSLPLLIALAAFLIYDIKTLYQPTTFAAPRGKFVDRGLPKPAVAVILEKDKKILLGRRGIDPAKGKWDILGGFIEREESAEETAAREIMEETGLRVRATKYLGSLPDVYGETKVPTINFCFVAEVEGGELKPQSDVESLAWFTPDELPQEMAFAHQIKVFQWYKESIHGIRH